MDYALKWYALILKKNVIWNEKGILHIVKCWKRPQNGQNKTGLWRDSTKKKQEATESLSYQVGLVMLRNTYPVQFFESFTKKAWDYASNRTNYSIFFFLLQLLSNHIQYQMEGLGFFQFDTFMLLIILNCSQGLLMSKKFMVMLLENNHLPM
jgi:hypothetical protein